MEDTTWWAEQRAIPMDDGLLMDDAPIVVRGETQGLARRSEYAELAELASAGGPRDPAALLREARRVGELLAERAYYDFPAGQGRVTGPSIDLMDALAIVWGRVVSRVEIVDERANRVHLRGRVIDLLALTAVERDYVSALAPAPGKFARDPVQSDRWRVMQLQSASSKAIRGALEHALPAWLVDTALLAARGAAARAATGGKPLPEARAAALQHLGALGLDRAALEAWVSQPLDLWTADELGRIRDLARGLRAGEVAVEAVRAQLAAAVAPTQAPGGDRLSGLGLGKPEEVAVGTSAPLPPQSFRPPVAPTAPAAAAAAPEPPKDPERAAVLEQLAALEAAIGDLEASLTDDVVLAAAKVAGLPVNVDGPVLDGAPEPLLRRYLTALNECAA